MLDAERFIQEKIQEIYSIVGNNIAINALSGGVDSSVVTVLGYKALGKNLKTYFIDNGLMRKNEFRSIMILFNKLGINVEIINAQEQFFNALAGVSDPEEKREAIAQTFYKDVFGKLVKDSKAKFLLQGTILTDVDETVAGIKRQHNVFEQLGIDPQEAFGYKIVEPLVQLRKDDVRMVGKEIGLPKEIYNRIPFPGPALAARVIGEITREKIAIIRKATSIIEEKLKLNSAFQYLAILHNDKVTGIKNGKRSLGCQIELRCWDSVNAITAEPTQLEFSFLKKLSQIIVKEISEVVSVTYNITSKPPSTIEAV